MVYPLLISSYDNYSVTMTEIHSIKTILLYMNQKTLLVVYK